MKKRLVSVFCFLLVILLLSFVSANWFSDFLGKITGKGIGDPCVDSDGADNFLESGFVQLGDSYYYDYCSENMVYDYYCYDFEQTAPGTGSVIGEDDDDDLGLPESPLQDVDKTSTNCQETYGLECYNGKCTECISGQTQNCAGLEIGECNPGIRKCSEDGVWGSCEGIVGPTPEKCDGLDNDCDGQIDENQVCGRLGGCNFWDPPRSCGSDVGECEKGLEYCGSDGDWTGVCEDEIGPTPEICDNGLDNDCDGKIDEGCSCINGQTQSCGKDTGECVSGIQTCSNNEFGGDCVGEISPTDEVCDGLDNNCDGQIDENQVCEELIDEILTEIEMHSNEVLICEDSDPNNDLYTIGYVQGLNIDMTNYEYTDECINEKQVSQYSCIEENFLKKSAYTCSENYICKNGVCSPTLLDMENLLVTPCIESANILPLKLLSACYNEEEKEIELNTFKGSGNGNINFLDFIIRLTGETTIFTCGRTCGECEIAEGSQTYFISLGDDDSKPKSVLLKTSNCITKAIEIEEC